MGRLPRLHRRSGIQALIKRVRERLETHKYCSAFENDLERVWPSEKALREKRAAAIEAFAKRHGWSVKIWDPGIRVTFRKLENSSSAKAA